jgi:hypothetical protein
LLKQSAALIQLYFEYAKLKLSAQYKVIVIFDEKDHHAGDALTVGFVLSNL